MDENHRMMSEGSPRNQRETATSNASVTQMMLERRRQESATRLWGVSIVLLALPSLVVLLALISSGASSQGLAVRSPALFLSGLFILGAVVLMVFADLAGGRRVTELTVLAPILGGCIIMFLALVVGALLNLGGRGASGFSSALSLAAIMTFAALLLGASLSRLLSESRASRTREGPFDSPHVRIRQLEQHIQVLNERLSDEKLRAHEYEQHISGLAAQLNAAEQSLTRERGELSRLRLEVDELRPLTSRLGELESWIWPDSGSGVDVASTLWRAIEQSCGNPHSRALGHSLFARLHLVAVAEDEPDRYAELLDLAGRVFYEWLDACGNASDEAGMLESQFLSFVNEYAARCDLELRPVRPGDTVDQGIHDPMGAGLQVIRPRSFYIRRRTDREVLRRALVEV